MKYTLLDVNRASAYRIKALKDFGDVKKGDLGGFVQSEENLSHEGDCWIYDTATVLDNAIVKGNAKVFDRSIICDNAKVYGNAVITQSSHICQNAKVYGNAMIKNDACIEGNAQIYGHAKVNDLVRVMGYATVHGNTSLSGTTIVQDHVSVSANDNFKNLRLQGSKSFATLNDYTLFTINHLFGDYYYISHIVNNEIVFEHKYSKQNTHDFIIYLQSHIPIGDPIFDELSHKLKLNEFKFASQGVNYSIDVIRVMNSF
ncbi:glucosamine N-acyltransferase [Bacillus phage vB_BauM_KLEB27-3]|nr:glucosamine N-acyltransferase [Bacillus phage vB_BauM_KLEB27-3]